MTLECCVEDKDLSVAWAKALRVALEHGGEAASLTVTVTGPGDGSIDETPSIRSAIDQILSNEKLQSIETVAGTIFPRSLWNRSAPRAQLFDRYRRILPRLRQCSKNRHGIYFERMISGGPEDAPNQLEHAIAAYTSRKGVRRSVLQVATFDPRQDHTTAAQRGFPCLQQVTFVPSRGALNVNAFYAMQYLVQRGYGNYLGLLRLGEFVAHELQLPLGQLTCLIGIAQCDLPKRAVSTVLSALDEITAS